MSVMRFGRRLAPVVVLVALLLGGASGPVLPRFALPAFTVELPGAVPEPALPPEGDGGASPSATAPPATAPPSPTPPNTTFAVSTTGDDSASGSESAPWRTLAHALAEAPPGSTIRLGPGEFAGDTARRPGVTIEGVGADSVITGGLIVRADDVTVTRVTLTGQTRPYHGGIIVEDASGTAIRDVVVRGNPFGIHLVNARGALVEDNLVTDNGYGVEIHGVTDGTVVSGNEIVDNDRRLDDSRAAGGVNLYFTSGGLILRDNRIELNDEVAIEVYAASDVSITGNRLSGSNDLIETGTEDGAPCRNLSITANVLYSADPEDSNEERGIYLRCASEAVVAWNTFANLDRFAIGLYAGSGQFDGPVDNVTIEHNVIAGGRAFSLDSALPRSVEIDRDMIWPCRADRCPVLGRQVAFMATANVGTERLAILRAETGYEAKGRIADPRFRDPAAGDFRVDPTSAAAGVAGADSAP